MPSTSLSWAGRVVLVTGAGGFIGSHLTEALVDLGAEVTAMIRYTSRSDWGNLEFLPPEKKAALQVVAGMVEDPHFVAAQVKGKDVVFHLAALIAIPYSYVAPQSYVRTNVEGTANILAAVRDHDVARLIHTSTSEAYGTARYTPIDEAHPLQPQSPYSASKIAADMLAESFYRSFGTPVAIARPFNTYGPRQSARAVIPTIISQALSDAPKIRLGSLTPVRDLNFVKDTVRAFILMAESDKVLGKVVNFGAGRGIAIGDLAEKILRLIGASKPVEHDEDRVRPALSEVHELIADNSTARELLGWQPQGSLTEGLTETIAFVRAHPHLFKAGDYAR
ncbi:MAG: GDP-mannose 4,6-dehydratase [Chthoniobacterales bacterium]